MLEKMKVWNCVLVAVADDSESVDGPLSHHIVTSYSLHLAARVSKLVRLIRNRVTFPFLARLHHTLIMQG